MIVDVSRQTLRSFQSTSVDGVSCRSVHLHLDAALGLVDWHLMDRQITNVWLRTFSDLQSILGRIVPILLYADLICSESGSCGNINLGDSHSVTSRIYRLIGRTLIFIVDVHKLGIEP